MTQNATSGASAGAGGFLDPRRVAVEFGFVEGMKIADFGCGSGEFAVIVAQMVGETGQVNAVDIMESRLDSLRAKAKISGLNNITTIRSNLEVPGSSGLEDYSQDAVLLANVLFQNPNKANIIKEANRVLKESGKLIVIDWKEETGTLGPPAELKTDAITLRNLITGLNFVFEKNIDAGMFHYGFIFSKIR